VRGLFEVLRETQLVVLGGLGVLALRLWLARRDAAQGWIAATFGLLGAVVVFARVLPTDTTVTWVAWATRVLVAVLVLFPYFLFRFMATFQRQPPWVSRGAAAATAVVAGWALLLPKIPGPGEARPASFTVYVYALLLQWTVLSVLVAARLWLAGRGQPTVARRRMRTLALGSVGVAVALLLSGTSNPGTDVQPLQIVTQVLVLLSAPLFLLGFAPPAAVLTYWRRRDEQALRDAEIGLMTALEPADVAESLLPRVTRLIGGRGAAIVARDGSIVGAHALDERQRATLGTAAAAQSHEGIVVAHDDALWVPLGVGWLVVLTTPFTPFFGREESRALLALGVLTDLALSRAALFERERLNTETMRDFVAIASHDLRTPTAVVTGYASLLQTRWSEISDKQKQDMVDAIGRQATHLARLIEDLLTVSQIEADAVHAVPHDVDLHAAVAELIGDLGPDYAAVALDVEPGLRAYVDPQHLTRILTNYVKNALVYGAPPVAVRARARDGRADILVADSGPGVPPEFRPRLFEKFARADRKTSKATQGTGLGLSIVRGLARAAGGDAWYEPNAPTGSVFGVRLPVPDETMER
jgi:signal transduction histidine kinase